MKTVGYYNGQIGPVEEIRVPLLERGLYFGDGVYDVVISRNGKPFTLALHLDRFYRSCQALEIDFPLEREALEALLRRLIGLAEDGDTMLYWQATRGVAPRKHEFPQGATPSLLAMVTPFHMGDPRKRMRLITQEDTRFLHCDVKTINLIPNVMAAQRAAEADCQEAVFHRGERVTECAHSSLFLFEKGQVVMPPLDKYVLPGITRRVVAQLCRDNGIPCQERVFTLEEMMAADEVLVASTTKTFSATQTIDGKPVGGKAPQLLERLQGLFLAEMDRQCS